MAAKQAAKTFNVWTRRDPELLVMFVGVCGALSLAGWTLSQHAAGGEGGVLVEQEGMPWNKDSTSVSSNFKYRYHPNGDPTNPSRMAPSAVHYQTVMIRLPRELHEKFSFTPDRYESKNFGIKDEDEEEAEDDGAAADDAGDDGDDSGAKAKDGEGKDDSDE